MRLFVAALPPPAVVEDLTEFLGPRREAPDGPRWSRPGQWHVTLAFMGSAPARVVEPLVDALADLVGRVPAGQVSIAGSVAFPSPYAARVLGMEVLASPAGWLAGLSRTVRSGCSVAGAAPEGGPFRPHLTLGRFGRPTEATRWLRVLDTYRSEVFDLSEVVLVESQLGSGRDGRVRHAVVARFPLAGP
jgi:2'-5' RNA ligase